MVIVKFTKKPEDVALIWQIANRGWKIDWLRASYEDFQSMEMDISATHANGNRLRLRELFEADDFNFAHDMSGIYNCLDRNTGKLTRNFRPRFSQPSKRVV